MVAYQNHKSLQKKIVDSPITAVDLFCGCGGLTHGLMRAGIAVQYGLDIDPQSAFAYEANNPGAAYLTQDIYDVTGPQIRDMFEPDKLTLLAGCAPCTPFSKLTHGMADHHALDLLDNFGHLVKTVKPDLVTMENVPELAERGRVVFDRFLAILDRHGYSPRWAIVKCERYGVPQSRRRLVLLGSRLGQIELPDAPYETPSRWKTVRETIGDLAPLKSGQVDPNDPLHGASRLSDLNLERIQHTVHDGGTWKAWPDRLKLACHKKDSGKTYGSIYGRMWWDKPSPTMTTLCTGIGNGRFGHPEQDRSITLREAAMFQSFPDDYEFWPADQKLNRSAVSRMIGNAVPPQLAKWLGKALIDHVRELS